VLVHAHKQAAVTGLNQVAVEAVDFGLV
jgi:hypothetical protein